MVRFKQIEGETYMTLIQIEGKKPLNNDELNKLIFKYTDELVKLSDDRALMTRSDFQGAVMAIVIKIVKKI